MFIRLVVIPCHRLLKRGQIELGVHIADVSHFVRPGSLTDTEAKTRYIVLYIVLYLTVSSAPSARHAGHCVSSEVCGGR